MNDIRKLIIDEVLAKGHLMSLATLDDGGVWVCHVRPRFFELTHEPLFGFDKKRFDIP
jgi:hypothetical protein